MIGNFPPVVGTKEERNLLRLFKSLTDQDKQTLLKFAEFLKGSSTGQQGMVHDSVDDKSSVGLSDSNVVPTPNLIERPPQESVIKAIKRLNKTYPMIDKSTLLDKTSGLMTEHLLKGRDAVSVIDELEKMFSSAYQDFLAGES